MDELAVAQPFGLFDQLAHAMPHAEQRGGLLLAGQRLAAATPPNIGLKDDLDHSIPPVLRRRTRPPALPADGGARGRRPPNRTRRPAALPRVTATVRQSYTTPSGGAPWL